MGSARAAGMPRAARAGQHGACRDVTCGRGGAGGSCRCWRRGVLHWCCRRAWPARSRPRDGAYPGACTGDVGAGRRPGCGRGRGGITVVRLRAGSRCRQCGRPGRPGGRRQVSPAGPRAAAADRRPAPPAARTPAPGPAAVVSAMLRAQIRALDPRAVLAAGLARDVLAARLPGIRVVTDPAMLPATTTPPPLGHLALLVRSGSSDAGTLAAVTTARVAGARVIAVRGADPRADPAAIAALSAARPRQVLAIGAGFGPAGRLASRIAVAQTGVQLPGGGQILFPGRLLVALYGHPGAPALGALGQQGLQASIARARHAAAAYRALSRVPVIPAFEIIATVAQARPGRDGDYSYQSTVASLRPWVRRAAAAGMYVILDLQPGRASLLAQARRYQPLLELPDVGLALDPEWKLAPRAAAAAPDRQREHQRGQHCHQMAGRPDRAAPPAPETPRPAPVQAVDDPRRARTRHPVSGPGDPHPHGRARHPGRQAADLAKPSPGPPPPGCSSGGRTSTPRTIR